MAIVLILTSESLLREKAKSTATLPVITDGVQRGAVTSLKTFNGTSSLAGGEFFNLERTKIQQNF